MFVLEGIRAREDQLGVVSAVRLGAGIRRLIGAECLGSIEGVLGSHKHGDRIVDGQRDEQQHDRGDEKSLRGCPASADLEDSDPEEADANCGNTGDGAAEQDEDQKGHQDVVDGESLGSLEEDPVHRLENVDLAEDVSATLLAD